MIKKKNIFFIGDANLALLKLKESQTCDKDTEHVVNLLKQA